MAKIKRNGPCPCGSGSKAKRCCYGTEETVHVGMLPKEIGDDAIADLKGTDEVELRTYFDQLLDLPEFDASLQVRLPGIITPDMDRAINALRDDDDDDSTMRSTRCCPLSIRPSDASLSLRQSSDFGTRVRSNGSSPPSPSSSLTAQSRCSSAPPWPNRWPFSPASSARQRDCL